MSGFSVGFPSLSPVEIKVEFPAGITCGISRDPNWDSRHFLPVESQLIPVGIPDKFSMGIVLHSYVRVTASTTLVN